MNLYQLALQAEVAATLAILVILLGAPTRAYAQESGATTAADASLQYDTPPAPAPPAVASERDPRGRLTIRAVRLTSPLTIDGRLDDEVYATVPSFGDFIQQDPAEGEPATERTEAWVFFDDRNVYISARMFVSQPDRIKANEMRRDNTNIFRNDFFSVTLDTLFDRRSAVFVMTNALGGQRDALVTDESRSTNFDYNMVWEARSQRFAEGWATEIAIPFKSMRYLQRPQQVWGIILARADYWKNEFSYLVPIPRAAGPSGSFRVSQAATLVGIDAPPPAMNLEVKPYLTGNSDTIPAPGGLDTELGHDYGVDVKYGLTKSLAADFTYNTDFAQVEVDDQQINLTRFSLFYPEKREFFLEGQGLFTFGGAAANAAGSRTPIIFFSRQIGLDEGRTIPIQAGGRVLGKVGPYNVGALHISTEAVPAAGAPFTRFSVVRVKRDILRRSSIGVIGTARTPSLVTDATNTVVGADVSLAFFTNLEAVSYYARSSTPGLSGDEESYRGRLFYNGDKYGLDADYLKVGNEFNPEVGFLPRRGFRRQYLLGRFSPRPNLPGIRRLFWDASVDNIEGADLGELQTRSASATFRIDFDSGDILTADFEHLEDRPETPFRVSGITVPAGNYQDARGTLSYQLGSQRKLTGTVSATTGGYYGGEQDGVSYNGRVEITKQLAVEPRVAFTWLDLPQGSVLTQLFSARTTFAMSPRMFVAAFLQYNSTTGVVGLNTRFRWEYRPGSDLYLVYSEGRNALGPGFPTLSGRQVAAKFTRLFRF